MLASPTIVGSPPSVGAASVVSFLVVDSVTVSTFCSVIIVVVVSVLSSNGFTSATGSGSVKETKTQKNAKKLFCEK